MLLINRETNESYEGLIERVKTTEVENLRGSSDFTFNWNEEKDKDVYKLTIKGKNEILGLLSITNIKEEFRVHINLIEASKKHRGKEKKIKNIPGCLIGFACRMAFRKGYGGFVSLIPKTYLIKYYQDNFGFVQMGRQLATYGENSRSLMAKYLGDEEI